MTTDLEKVFGEMAAALKNCMESYASDAIWRCQEELEELIQRVSEESYNDGYNQGYQDKAQQ